MNSFNFLLLKHPSLEHTLRASCNFCQLFHIGSSVQNSRVTNQRKVLMVISTGESYSFWGKKFLWVRKYSDVRSSLLKKLRSVHFLIAYFNLTCYNSSKLRLGPLTRRMFTPLHLGTRTLKMEQWWATSYLSGPTQWNGITIETRNYITKILQLIQREKLSAAVFLIFVKL